ncbi:PepSY domain-containing protein [Streptomyces sp. NPDC056169]|uniref:PepSY domain-containing protein n=1 Tax=Streptomyces sp. NPDC056169 TaxID=3345734 RepID=UPI0035E38A64
MKRKLVLATATAVALVTGGTAVALAAGGTESAPVQQVRAALDQDDDGAGDGAADDRGVRTADRITAVQAIDAAVKARPGTVVSAELDDDKDEDQDDGWDDGWEVVVLGARGSTTHTVHVDPVSGRVLGTDTDTDDDSDDAAEDAAEDAAVRNAKVGARQAAQAAAAKGFVTSVELDDEDDRPATGWDVGVRPTGGAEDDWSVDVKTGALAADHDD